jgi:hypothetical protein
MTWRELGGPDLLVGVGRVAVLPHISDRSSIGNDASPDFLTKEALEPRRTDESRGARSLFEPSARRDSMNYLTHAKSVSSTMSIA